MKTELQEKSDAAVMALIRDKNIAVENLTREQVASAFLQAIQCGDFKRFVLASSDGQSVVYLPYAREQELQIERDDALAAIHAAHGLLSPLGNQPTPTLAIREATQILANALENGRSLRRILLSRNPSDR